MFRIGVEALRHIFKVGGIEKGREREEECKEGCSLDKKVALPK